AWSRGANSVYVGRRTAAARSRQLAGRVGTDDVALEITALFDDRNVGTDKTVTGSLSLSGDDRASYALTSGRATTKASITAKTVTGKFTAADKLYDGTNAAS